MAKQSEFTKWLDDMIARKEKQIMEHNGMYPNEFEALMRYINARQWYEEAE